MKNNPRITHLKILSRGKKKGGITAKVRISAWFKIRSNLFFQLFTLINGLFIIGFSNYFHACDLQKWINWECFHKLFQKEQFTDKIRDIQASAKCLTEFPFLVNGKPAASCYKMYQQFTSNNTHKIWPFIYFKYNCF